MIIRQTTTATAQYWRPALNASRARVSLSFSKETNVLRHGHGREEGGDGAARRRQRWDRFHQRLWDTISQGVQSIAAKICTAARQAKRLVPERIHHHTDHIFGQRISTGLRAAGGNGLYRQSTAGVTHCGRLCGHSSVYDLAGGAKHQGAMMNWAT